ncbi:MAG: glycosyltransferase [Desulfobacterales bacterium]|nr:glycosyltransferase [Desulfobacterales bacterium]
MDYHANIEGVTWFCNDVFPAVKSEFPESQFYIVGSKPHPKVRNLGSNDGVRVTGFVEDIRPYYQAADVCVIPLRLARGIQNKVLEAMAMGKAVVTTSKAIEGIRAATGKQVLVEDTPNGFSNMVLTLIKDRETRKRLGTNARQFVMKNYNWSTNMKKLDALLQA